MGFKVRLMFDVRRSMLIVQDSRLRTQDSPYAAYSGQVHGAEGAEPLSHLGSGGVDVAVAGTSTITRRWDQSVGEWSWKAERSEVREHAALRRATWSAVEYWRYRGRAPNGTGEALATACRSNGTGYWISSVEAPSEYSLMVRMCSMVFQTAVSRFEVHRAAILQVGFGARDWWTKGVDSAPCYGVIG